MKKIKFLVDYQGVLTYERFYSAGCVEEFDGVNADALVSAGRAEYVIDEPVQAKPPQVKPAAKRRRNKKAAS